MCSSVFRPRVTTSRRSRRNWRMHLIFSSRSVSLNAALHVQQHSQPSICYSSFSTWSYIFISRRLITDEEVGLGFYFANRELVFRSTVPWRLPRTNSDRRCEGACLWRHYEQVLVIGPCSAENSPSKIIFSCKRTHNLANWFHFSSFLLLRERRRCFCKLGEEECGRCRLSQSRLLLHWREVLPTAKRNFPFNCWSEWAFEWSEPRMSCSEQPNTNMSSCCWLLSHRLSSSSILISKSAIAQETNVFVTKYQPAPSLLARSSNQLSACSSLWRHLPPRDHSGCTPPWACELQLCMMAVFSAYNIHVYVLHVIECQFKRAMMRFFCKLATSNFSSAFAMSFSHFSIFIFFLGPLKLPIHILQQYNYIQNKSMAEVDFVDCLELFSRDFLRFPLLPRIIQIITTFSWIASFKVRNKDCIRERSVC